MSEQKDGTPAQGAKIPEWHTPLPWAATTRKGSWDWVIYSTKDPNIEICQLFHDGTEDNETGEANAELIVQAVNAFARSPAAVELAQGAPATVSELTKLAAECHRAKWQFDFDDESRPRVARARELVHKAFDELHRIGDIALKMRDDAKVRSPAECAPDVWNEAYQAEAVKVAVAVRRLRHSDFTSGYQEKLLLADALMEVVKLVEDARKTIETERAYWISNSVGSISRDINASFDRMYAKLTSTDGAK